MLKTNVLVLTLAGMATMPPSPNNSNDIPDPSPEDLAFITDVGIKPHKRKAAQGVADMKNQLARLEAELEAWKNSPEIATRLRQEIRDTQLRLQEYELQARSLN